VLPAGLPNVLTRRDSSALSSRDTMLPLQDSPISFRATLLPSSEAVPTVGSAMSVEEKDATGL